MQSHIATNFVLGHLVKHSLYVIFLHDNVGPLLKQ